jgi:exopolyphosphatase
VTVVSGGAAADLDSLVASIAYAYLLHREGGTGGPVLPYLPISRANLVLRGEAVYLFDRTGLRKSALFFADDVDLAQRLCSGNGELVLVDTQGEELAAALKARVVEVIDHHPGEQVEYAHGAVGDPVTHAPGKTAPSGSPSKLRRRILEAVGSTCTLVSEQIFRRKPEILDPQLAELLLAAVLLDTVNLDRSSGRATVRDRETARRLMKAADVETVGLYEDLVRARGNVEGLSSAQLLAKDYKERSAGSLRFGMSSVPLLIESWERGDESLGRVLTGFLLEKGLDLLVLLTYGHGDGFKRQLVLCSADEGLVNRVTAELSDSLGLEEIPRQFHGGAERKRAGVPGARRAEIRRFAQRETEASRKVIEPRLRKILERL